MFLKMVSESVKSRLFRSLPLTPDEANGLSDCSAFCFSASLLIRSERNAGFATLELSTEEDKENLLPKYANYLGPPAFTPFTLKEY